MQDKEAVREQLDKLLIRLSGRYRVIFHAADVEPREPILERFMDWLSGAEEGGVQVADVAAYAVRDTLLDETERESVAFWASPLGRLIARIAGPGEGVTVAVAGAALGVSRQRVHELIRAGRLAHEGGKVSGKSVRDFIAARP